MIERKPSYIGEIIKLAKPEDYDYVNLNSYVCLESDLREVEEQRDRLIQWLLEIISHGPDIYGKDWKDFYKEDFKKLKEITGLSWEELKRKVEE